MTRRLLLKHILALELTFFYYSNIFTGAWATEVYGMLLVFEWLLGNTLAAPLYKGIQLIGSMPSMLCSVNFDAGQQSRREVHCCIIESIGFSLSVERCFLRI